MKKLKRLVIKSTLAAAILATGGITATSNIYAEPQQDPDQAGIPSADHREPGQRHHHKGHLKGGPIITDTASLIGTEPKLLLAQLEQGKTLLQIVHAKKGWSETEYLQQLTIKAFQHIDKVVAEGKLTKEQAEKIKADLPTRLKTVINRTWKSAPPGYPVSEYKNNTIQWNVSE